MNWFGYVDKSRLEDAKDMIRDEKLRTELEREEKEKAQKGTLEALKVIEEEKKAKNEAEIKARSLKESLENEKIQSEHQQRESTVKQRQLENEKKKLEQETEVLMKSKHRSEEEQRALLLEKEEREKIEIEQKRFNWGPKKEPTWTERDIKRLQDVVLKDREDSEGNQLNLKVLVFGPTGHGKSSFCNSSRSAIKGYEYPATYHQVGGGRQGTLTRGFHGAPYGRHWIIDMAGIFESDRISSMNIEDIASGKMPFYTEITDTLDRKDNDNDVPKPGENDVSCVVVVIRYDTELGPELKRQLGVILALGGKGVISCHLVLTRLDECDPQFNLTENIPKLYKSAKVQAAIKRMSEETGIPPYAISFVKNYTTETETDIFTTLLHLRALERVIFSALDQVENRLDKEKQRNAYTHKTKIKLQEEIKSRPLKETFDFSQASEETRNQMHDKEEKTRKPEEKGEVVVTMNEIKFMLIVLIFAVLFIYFKN